MRCAARVVSWLRDEAIELLFAISKRCVMLLAVKIARRCASSIATAGARELQQAYAALELHSPAQRNSIEALKTNYVKLLRKYHPDTGGSEACTEKLNAVQSAYRVVRKILCGILSKPSRTKHYCRY